MDVKLEEALNKVETNYAQLVEIVNDVLDPILKPVNDLVNSVNANINNLTVDQLRDYILRLQLKAFEISEIKEKSVLKADLSAALQKEAFAIQFGRYEGSAAAKDKYATVAVSAETVSVVMYDLMANLLKTKVDQLHRLVDAMKSILMSRMQEAKFMNIGVTNDIPTTTNGKVILNE